MFIRKALTNTSAAVAAPVADTGSAVTVEKFDGNAAAEIAKRLASELSDEAQATLSGLMKAKEESVQGTIALMLKLQANYGPQSDDENDEGEIALFPRPDTDTGNKRDEFEIEVTGSDGKTTTKKASFYVIFADASPQGSAINQEIDEIKRAMDTNANQSGIREEIAELNPQQLSTRLEFLTGRRATVRAAIKKAMALHFKFEDVNALRYVQAEPLWVDADDYSKGVVATTKPIMVWQPPEEGKPVTKWAHYGIGQFLKLDTKKAEEKGGTFAALTETAKKKTGGAASGNQPATETPVIKTVDTGIGRMVELHRWAEEITGPQSDKADYGKLLKLVNHKDADELAVTIVELSNFLNDIRKEAKLDARYVKLQQAGSELAKTAA